MIKEFYYDNFEIFPKNIFKKENSYLNERQKIIISEYIDPCNISVQIDDNYVYVIGIGFDRQVFDYFGNIYCYRFDGFSEFILYLRQRKKYLEDESTKDKDRVLNFTKYEF